MGFMFFETFTIILKKILMLHHAKYHEIFYKKNGVVMLCKAFKGGFY